MKKLAVLFALIIIAGCIIHEEEQAAPPTSTAAGIVAIFVDENTYQALQTEIDRYVADVELDLNTNVSLFHGNWTSADEVRSELLKLRDDLMGTVLIGDIPVIKFEMDCPVPIFCAPEFVSDRYYMDLESSMFVDEDNNGKFDGNKYIIVYDPMRIIWAGRIKPYAGGQAGIDMLRSYFDRNHAYRTGQLQISEKMFLYSPSIQSGPTADTEAQYIENVLDFVADFGRLYSRDQIDILVNSSADEFLAALQKPYEIISIAAHGNEFIQNIGTEITGDQIKNATPAGYFYFLFSCSAGDFSKQDYLAGHYLFDGNGLAVYAFTMAVMAGADEAKRHEFVLSYGETFGQTLIQESYLETQAIIIGDPTLRIREPVGVPKIEVSRTAIDFGNVPVGSEEVEIVVLENRGNGTALYDLWFAEMMSEEFEIGMQYGMMSDEILPGQSTSITFYFRPEVVGNYTGHTAINTNDPDNTAIIIDFYGRGV